MPSSERHSIAPVDQEMPRFFFNLRCPDGSVIDPDGAEFANADGAYDAAARTARTLMATDTDPEVDWLRCTFEVADEAGEVVFELSFIEAVQLAESPQKH
jgi:hypothetical protein